jgi:hypothetical protein
VLAVELVAVAVASTMRLSRRWGIQVLLWVESWATRPVRCRPRVPPLPRKPA